MFHQSLTFFNYFLRQNEVTCLENEKTLSYAACIGKRIRLTFHTCTKDWMVHLSYLLVTGTLTLAYQLCSCTFNCSTQGMDDVKLLFDLFYSPDAQLFEMRYEGGSHCKTLFIKRGFLLRASSRGSHLPDHEPVALFNPLASFCFDSFVRSVHIICMCY